MWYSASTTQALSVSILPCYCQDTLLLIVALCRKCHCLLEWIDCMDTLVLQCPIERSARTRLASTRAAIKQVANRGNSRSEPESEPKPIVVSFRLFGAAIGPFLAWSNRQVPGSKLPSCIVQKGLTQPDPRNSIVTLDCEVLI